MTIQRIITASCFFLLLVMVGVVEATNISTGEPCNLGITDFRDRQRSMILWVAAPAVLGTMSAVLAWCFFRARHRQETAAAKRKWGILTGFWLAVSLVSGMILLVGLFLPRPLF